MRLRTILRVLSGNTEIPLTNGPVAVGMKMLYQPASSYVRQDSEKPFFVPATREELIRLSGGLPLRDCFHGCGTAEPCVGRRQVSMMLSWIRRYIIWDRLFSYPERICKGMKWLGRGPYRVWKNRIPGTNYGIWHKDYNNTVTVKSYDNLVYPEFKGYHANMYWATFEKRYSTFYCLFAYGRYFLSVSLHPKNRKAVQNGPCPNFLKGIYRLL